MQDCLRLEIRPLGVGVARHGTVQCSVSARVEVGGTLGQKENRRKCGLYEMWR